MSEGPGTFLGGLGGAVSGGLITAGLCIATATTGGGALALFYGGTIAGGVVGGAAGNVADNSRRAAHCACGAQASIEPPAQKWDTIAN